MASGMFQFDAGHHAAVVLLGFGATLVLPISRVRVLRLYKRQVQQLFFQALLVIWPI